MQRLEEEERNKPETDMVLKSVSNFSYLAAVRNVYDQAEESETVCEDSSRDQLTEESASFSSPLFSRMSMTRPSSGTELRPGSSEKKLYRISSGIALVVSSFNKFKLFPLLGIIIIFHLLVL